VACDRGPLDLQRALFAPPVGPAGGWGPLCGLVIPDLNTRCRTSHRAGSLARWRGSPGLLAVPPRGPVDPHEVLKLALVVCKQWREQPLHNSALSPAVIHGEVIWLSPKIRARKVIEQLTGG